MLIYMYMYAAFYIPDAMRGELDMVASPMVVAADVRHLSLKVNLM